MKKGFSLLMVIVMVMLVFLAGCGGGSDPATAEEPAGLEKMTVQMKWLPQAQFMGYYVAQAKGYYEEEGIDIELLPGGSDIIPEQMVFNGVADVGVTWVSSLLKYQEQGWDLKHVSQTFQNSGMLLVAKAESGIQTPADLAGKDIGSWFGGNEYELLALLETYGLDRNTDVNLVQQDFTMNQIIEDRIDVASAMVYNELGLLVSEGFPLEELTVIDFNDEGVAMMQDCMFVSQEWIEDNEDLFVRFLRASLKGWADAVEDPEGAAQIVYDVDGSVSIDHQTYMAQEVAKLTIPEGFDPAMIGYTDMDAIQQTADIAFRFGLLDEEASITESTFTNQYWEEAMK